MPDKTRERKAREYEPYLTAHKKARELYPDSFDDDLYPQKLQWRVNAERKAYISGYTQAEKDISTANEQLRGALEHLVNLCDAGSAEEVVFYETEHNIDLDTVLAKAKTLLNE